MANKNRVKKEEKFEKIEEQSHDDTDKKIAEMVAKTKKFVKGEIPNAEKLIEEAGKLAAKEVPATKVEEPKSEIQKEKKTQKKVPKMQELQDKKNESSREAEKRKKEQEEVANLTKELIRKGTLRK